MPRPLVWSRMYRGKVWHLRDAQTPQAVCGLVADEDLDEIVHGPVPVNARVCEACGAASDQIAEAIAVARAGDPRVLLPGISEG